jgi:predicted DNA-binding transcriptional regulator YafY
MQETDFSEPGLRWSVAQRLEFIEFRLVWEGRINRADVAKKFGVTVQQATGDLQAYERLAPNNLSYDRNAKTFVASQDFEPVLLNPLADRQLLQLAAIANGLVAAQETWFQALPEVSVVPVPLRHVSTTTIRWVLEAIRMRSTIEIEYQSVKSPEALRRSIAPHALAHDGARWHVRAWCQKNRNFRDFVLSRIISTGRLSRSEIDPLLDREWSTTVDIVLGPNPELSEGARRSLSKEYHMTRGRLRLPTRVALAFYTRQHLNLDLDLPPSRKQLVLLNRDEVDAAVAAAEAATVAALRESGKSRE